MGEVAEAAVLADYVDVGRRMIDSHVGNNVSGAHSYSCVRISVADRVKTVDRDGRGPGGSVVSGADHYNRFRIGGVIDTHAHVDQRAVRQHANLVGDGLAGRRIEDDLRG